MQSVILLLVRYTFHSLLSQYSVEGGIACVMAREVAIISTAFIAAVTGFLSPPPLSHKITDTHPGWRCPTSAVRSNYCRASADAWNQIDAVAAPVVAADANRPLAEVIVESDVNDGHEELNVDVRSIPSFAFFAGVGGRQREDVMGASDIAYCRTRLQTKLASLWGRTSESVRSMHEVGDDTKQKGSLVADILDKFDQRKGTIEMQVDRNVSMSSQTPCVVDVSSRDELLRIVKARREGQGPVVVMYHATHCRKCAYLTPMFRRLAERAVKETKAPDGADRGDDGESTGTTRTNNPVFCRVDVSAWGARTSSDRARDSDEVTVAGRGSDGVIAASTMNKPQQPRAIFAEGHGDGAVLGDVNRKEGGGDVQEMHEGSADVMDCDVCKRSGFVLCGECEGKGAVARSSPDGKHTLAVTCPACVGYKKLRCPTCGGKCYMCD